MTRAAPRPLSDADIGLFRKLARQGRTRAEIAEALGRTRDVIGCMARRYGIVVANDKAAFANNGKKQTPLGEKPE